MDSKLIEKQRRLVRRLEDEARVTPQRYRAKVVALALAGHGVLLALLLVAIGVPLLVLVRVLTTDAAFDPMLAFPLVACAALGAVLARALWLRFDVPDGYRLALDEAPELWAEVERVRSAIGAPSLQGIVIDGELNAAAAWVPRLGGLFGHRQYLVLGLPLMGVLGRDELASVIAHEFGHFSGGHGRISGWIYRVRAGWYRMLDGFASGGGGPLSPLISLVAMRYVPYFNAYSFVLAREQEYHADTAAVHVAGAEVAGSALARLDVVSRRLQRFSETQASHARMQPQPPTRPLADLCTALQSELVVERSRLQALAAREVDPDDTHPTLALRLEAMQASGALQAASVDRADALLGEWRAPIERALEVKLRTRMESRWRATYASAAADRGRLDVLDRRTGMSIDEAVEYAVLVESLRGDPLAEPAWRRVVEAQPDHAAAHHHLGLIALRCGECEAAKRHLVRAMDLDAGALAPTFAAIDRVDADPDADATCLKLVEDLRASHGSRAHALQLRDGIDGDDVLLAHDLDDAALRGLRARLAAHAKIARAWLACKGGTVGGEPPHYVLLLDWRGSIASENAGLKALGDALSLPGSYTVFTGITQRDLARRVRDLCQEPVFQRGKAS